MTDRHCHVWLQKNISILGGVLQTFMHQFDDGILCTLSPNHNVYKENGVYQQWTTYTLKSKSVPGMYFPAIWRSKFTDLANSKKLNLWEITTVDKSLHNASHSSVRPILMCWVFWLGRADPTHCSWSSSLVAA